jgi:hypothetical protein
MQKAGYRPSTVKTRIRSLKAVARRANLLDPESVKGYLATASVSVNRKQTVTEHLARFYKFASFYKFRFYKWKRIPFQAPHYKRIETVPFIPLESEVDQLIAGTGSKVAAFLQLFFYGRTAASHEYSIGGGEHRTQNRRGRAMEEFGR